MCNIAGYAGNRPAAPILLQMLRRQEWYDGNVSTGVVTIHEGRLHYRKIVGTVDDLIEKTDVLELPGTIGIAHTRPSGDRVAYQPCISPDETFALATNGIFINTPHVPGWNEAVKLLVDKGYTFQHILSKKGKPPCLPDGGNQIFPPEVLLMLVKMYVEEGKSLTEALALSCSHMFADNATVVISQRQPDSFFAMRTSRPCWRWRKTVKPMLPPAVMLLMRAKKIWPGICLCSRLARSAAPVSVFLTIRSQ